MKYLYFVTFVLINTIIVAGFIFFNETYLQARKSAKFVSPEIVNYLSNIQKGLLKSSILTTETYHKIIGVDRDPGIMAEYGIPYRYRFLVTIENGKQADIYITEDELETTQFVLNKNNSVRSIGMQDFLPGDEITLERSYKYNVAGDYKADRVRTKITKTN